MTSLEKGIWGSPIRALALVLVAAAPLWAQARLSPSVQRHVASKSAEPIDVIIRRSPDESRAIAARQGLQITKVLSDSAVFRASAAEIEALATEVDHISPDVEVKSFMSVTNAAIGADQVQAGLEGLSPFTGAGVGIALIDSGVWTGHRALAGRVVFAKDFVGDGLAGDPYGHGTHIGATIAGSSPLPPDPTSPIPFRGVAPGAHLISLRAI